MSNGFDKAKAQRNWLERLGEKIPGYRGFADRELRRDVDKLQREHLAQELTGIKNGLRQKARAYADAGQIAALTPFDRLERRLDGLAQTIRFTDYGASGLFDAQKVGEAELERLYQFDLALVEDLALLAGEAAAVPPPGGDASAAFAALDQRVGEIETNWAARKTILSGIVESV